MRPEPNNDIDLLLRQLSRRNGSPVSETEEQHLDADELNSYVANALPTAARARYTEHLADCSSCRKLVAQLGAAQGTVSEEQSANVVASWSLKSFFASLLSPMVLRYAVPALGLIGIAVVGIVVFRGNQRPGTIASLTDADQNKVAVNQPQPAQSASPQVYYDNRTVTNDDKARVEKDATRGVATGPVAPVTTEAPAIAKGAADAAGTVAAEPPPAAPKAAAAEENVDSLKLKKDAPADKQAAAREANKERDEANKNEPAKAETSTVTVTQDSAARKDITVRNAKSSETNAARGTDDLKRSAAPMTGTASARAQEDSRSREQSNQQAKPTGTFASGETRSVAGRRFRKSGGVWIDSGYESSKPVTNVARGSEQYRALIGDEPSLREIADQLDGEIIVVWKGRIYRIR